MYCTVQPQLPFKLSCDCYHHFICDHLHRLLYEQPILRIVHLAHNTLYEWLLFDHCCHFDVTTNLLFMKAKAPLRAPRKISLTSPDCQIARSLILCLQQCRARITGDFLRIRRVRSNNIRNTSRIDFESFKIQLTVANIKFVRMSW